MSIILDGTNGVDSPDLNITGTGVRITGDFSNATVANRVMFQTSTVNGGSDITVMPNGTGTSAGLLAYSTIDFSGTSTGNFAFATVSPTEYSIGSGRVSASASQIPITFKVGASEKMRIDTSGNVLVTSAAGLGYGTGSGGTVTQATSKSTAVTLNKPTGQITMNGAALAAGASVSFVLNNSLITTTDNVIVNCTDFASNPDGYTLRVRSSSGAASITVTSNLGTSASEAIKINFAIIKGAIS